MKQINLPERTRYRLCFVRHNVFQVFLLLLVFLPSFLYAGGAENGSLQDTKKIQGVVVDESGVPLPGVAVKVKGEQKGTATDVNGVFELVIGENPDAVLEFSFIGMKPQEVRVGNRLHIRITMVAQHTELEEVMVVAYGTVKKESFTGSAVSVQGDKLTQAAASRTSAVQALQGNVAGVRFSRTSGQPGDLSSIQIRGIGSLNESTAPLYIIDGVTISSGLNM